MKIKKYKLFFLLTLSFGFGFLIHAFFFPDLFSNGLSNIFASSLLSTPKEKGASVKDDFITYIDYDGQEFIPNRTTIKKGNYIAITNRSNDKKMWLFSDNELLNTDRGYASSERLQVLLPKTGQFTVINKLSPDKKLIVTVK